MSIAAMIARSAMASVITDPRLPDNPIVACNAAFEALTGYSRSEILGRNCRFLAGPGRARALSAELKAAVIERRPLLAQVLNYRKDGSAFENALLIVPVFDADGELLYFLGSQSDVSGRSPRGGQLQPDGSADRLSALTSRQEQVLACMMAGKRNKEIAHVLGVPERTIKMHRANLLAALGVTASADAIRLAAEVGWHLDRPVDRVAPAVAPAPRPRPS